MEQASLLEQLRSVNEAANIDRLYNDAPMAVREILRPTLIEEQFIALAENILAGVTLEDVDVVLRFGENLPDVNVYSSKVLGILIASNEYKIAEIFDINGMAQVNRVSDETGDMYIRKVLDIVQANLPEGAVIARAGGDEFVILVTADKEMDYSSVRSSIREDLNHFFVPSKANGETHMVRAGVTFSNDKNDIERVQSKFVHNEAINLETARDALRNYLPEETDWNIWIEGLKDNEILSVAKLIFEPKSLEYFKMAKEMGLNISFFNCGRHFEMARMSDASLTEISHPDVLKQLNAMSYEAGDKVLDELIKGVLEFIKPYVKNGERIKILQRGDTLFVSGVNINTSVLHNFININGAELEIGDRVYKLPVLRIVASVTNGRKFKELKKELDELKDNRLKDIAKTYTRETAEFFLRYFAEVMLHDGKVSLRPYSRAVALMPHTSLDDRVSFVSLTTEALRVLRHRDLIDAELKIFMQILGMKLNTV